MADRTVNLSADLYARIPVTEEVIVRVVNPISQVIVSDEEAIHIGDGRYRYTLQNVDMTGLWRVVWEYEDQQGREQRNITDFTVGTDDVASLTKFDVRAAIAQRTGEVHSGEVFEAIGSDFIDPTVIGGSGNYVKWWIITDEGGVSVPRRVQSYSGSGFVVAPEFEYPVPLGTPYILMNESPYAIDRALEQSVSEVSDTARIEVHVPNIPISEGGIQVPRGLRDVHQVLLGDGTEVPFNGWRLRSGRRLLITNTAGQEFAQVIGTRPAGIPQWDDSRLDYDSGTIVARGASLIHAKNARGQGKDMDENLRRQMAAMEEFEMARRRSSGRPFAGSRTVVE